MNYHFLRSPSKATITKHIKGEARRPSQHFCPKDYRSVSLVVLMQISNSINYTLQGIHGEGGAGFLKQLTIMRCCCLSSWCSTATVLLQLSSSNRWTVCLRRCASRRGGCTHRRIRWRLCLVWRVVSTATGHLRSWCPDTRQWQRVRWWRAWFFCWLWTLALLVFRFLFNRYWFPLAVWIDCYFFYISTEIKYSQLT